MKVKDAIKVLISVRDVYRDGNFELVMYDSKTDSFRKVEIGGLHLIKDVGKVDEISSKNSSISVFLGDKYEPSPEEG